MIRSLESVHAHLPEGAKVIVVDGGSPRKVRDELADLSRRWGFKFIRTEHLLTPNEAHNLGGRAVDTPWMAFIDNDVLVSDGWLAPLRNTAEREGAAMVAPVTLEGEWAEDRIHDFGGYLTDVTQGRIHSCRVHQPFCHQRFSQVRSQMKSGPADILEFHTLLLRTECFHQIGGMDERLLNTREHVDFCLEARKRGMKLWVDSDSVVTHLLGAPYHWMDYPYYLLRWNREWHRRTIEYFTAKWNFQTPPDFWASHFQWLDDRRRRALRDGLLRPIRRVICHKNGSYRQWALPWLDRIEGHFIAKAMSQRTRAAGKNTVSPRLQCGLLE